MEFMRGFIGKEYHIWPLRVKLAESVAGGYHARMSDTIVVQIIGTKKSAETRKAMRYFSERGVKAHIVDLSERALRRGELENITRRVSPDELIDIDGTAYRQGGYAYLDFDPVEELLENPLLMKIPVVRCGSEVTVGENRVQWDRWLGR